MAGSTAGTGWCRDRRRRRAVLAILGNWERHLLAVIKNRGPVPDNRIPTSVEKPLATVRRAAEGAACFCASQVSGGTRDARRWVKIHETVGVRVCRGVSGTPASDRIGLEISLWRQDESRSGKCWRGGVELEEVRQDVQRKRAVVHDLGGLCYDGRCGRARRCGRGGSRRWYCICRCRCRARWWLSIKQSNGSRCIKLRLLVL